MARRPGLPVKAARPPRVILTSDIVPVMNSPSSSPILTTPQAAKILGVSSRTAQLWIESGVIPSWKTPGGHRRMFESDVLAALAANDVARPASRRVLVLAPEPDHGDWERALAALDVAEVVCTDNPVAAAVALGANVPDVFALQVNQLGDLRPDFLSTLHQMPVLNRLQIVIAGRLPASTVASIVGPALRYKHILLDGAPEQLTRALVRHTALLPLALRPLPPALLAAPFPVGADEGRRLLAVERAAILDSAPEAALDNIVELAALSLDAPVALITVLSEDRQWFKARVGLDMRESPRSWAFCNYTLMGSGVCQLSDLDRDPRFADNPAVAGAPHFRYYAGAPVVDDQGYALGSLCVIDTQARALDPVQAQILTRLAGQASAEIARRIRGRQR